MPVPDLPTTLHDYVAYSNTNLPDHYSDPNYFDDPIATSDNTPVFNQISNPGATLGRVLFYDKRMSANNTISCASCHIQEFAFADTAQFSRGFAGGLTGRHSPGLTNARYYFRENMFWDERAATIEDQALQPIQDAVEMGLTLAEMRTKIREAGFYYDLFEEAFGDTIITDQRVSFAIAQFVRSMVSYQSKMDVAMEDDNNPATPADLHSFTTVFDSLERRGLALFQRMPPPDQIALGVIQPGDAPVVSLACDQCHQTSAQILSIAMGPGGGPGLNPQNIGLDSTVVDPGANGQGAFKVPSLRNIEFTAPYMHDGRFETLEEVVRFYSDSVIDVPETSRFLRLNNDPAAPVQRFNIDQGDVNALVAFMKTLSDSALITSELFSDPFVPVECSKDAFEPNDMLAQAAPLPLTGVNRNALICLHGDVDYFSFVVGAKTNIQVTLSNIDPSFQLQLFNESGTTIGTSQGTDIKTLIANGLTMGETYYVRISALGDNYDASKGYTLRWQRRATPFANTGSSIRTTDVAIDFALNAYPNPTSGQLHIVTDSPEATTASLAVFNVKGQKVHQQSFDTQAGKNAFTVQTDNWKSGIYFLKWRQGSQLKVKQIVVSH